jgi:RiboL-PSP-HEPN
MWDGVRAPPIALPEWSGPLYAACGMRMHTAQSLFAKNIASAQECLALFDGMAALKTSLAIDWVLRAGIVFVASALDTYFHDKVKYRVGAFSPSGYLPPALGKFEIPLSELAAWDGATRKGNVIRNWVTDSLSTVPLQKQSAIADALRLADITDLWNKVEPDNAMRVALLDELSSLIRRRNQIAHEGDRETSRRSGKRLRPIDRSLLADAIDFTTDLVSRIERQFPD